MSKHRASLKCPACHGTGCRPAYDPWTLQDFVATAFIFVLMVATYGIAVWGLWAEGMP